MENVKQSSRWKKKKQSWEERSMNFEGGKCKAKNFDYWVKDNKFLQLREKKKFNKRKK